MPIERRPWITRAMLQAEPGTLFVFGDNMERWGMGGQAKAMRGEPNAVGIVTKSCPRHFLVDAMAAAVAWVNEPAWRRLADHLMAGGTVVIPADGIGTGRAELAERAPIIAELIAERIAGLERIGR